MNRIHFDNMKNKWFWISVLILSLIFIFIGGFELVQSENAKLNKWIGAIGFFLQVIYYSKMFWHKNYVQWNKKGAVVRINSFLGKTLIFNEIKSIELIDKKLKTTKINGKTTLFDLNNIAEPDTQKLKEILMENVIINHA